MEPGYTAPRINPEQAPSLPPVSPEFSPGVTPERSAEHGSARPEREPAVPQQPQGAQPTVAPVLPQPVTSGQATDDDAASLVAGAPDVAADDDLIEKEWVDKAKRIITETANDPHRREAAVAQLQREYLRKRYGKELGASG